MSNAEQLDQLAQEFVDRYRGGERPRITEFVERHPLLGDQIRELFPTLILMEDLGPARDAARVAPAPEQIGEYRILREIGRGGMGVVYEAEQVSLGRHVALKVLPDHLLAEPTVLERFRREAQAAARLHHSNIVPVFAVGEHAGVHFYAMQFLRGQPLTDVLAELARLRSSGTRALHMPGDAESKYFRSVARIGAQVADALAYAHRHGVLHRDIKPSNLLLDASGNAWITDFGLAQAEGTDDLTRTGDIVGTLQYMAPERFRGMADARSDIYGLGLTLHEMLTLRPAFGSIDRNRLVAAVMEGEPPPPRRYDASIPRDLETIVLRATARDASHRYETAAAMRDDLQRFLRREPVQARRSTLLQRGVKWARRRPAIAALLGVSAASLVALLVGTAWHSGQLADALGVTRSQEIRSRALALAGASVEAGKHDPMLALLLAREAARTQSLPLAISQLHHAVVASHERAVLQGHEGEVTHASFSARGHRILTLSADSAVPGWKRDGIACVWDRHGRKLATLHADSPLRDAAWSVDGRRIVALTREGKLVAWDALGEPAAAMEEDRAALRESRDERFDKLDHPARLRQAAVSTDGARILTTCWDRTGRLWNREGELLALLQGHDDRINSVAIAPAGGRMLTTSIDQTIRIWDATGGLVSVLRGHHDEVLDASFSPDGRHVVSASKDGTARVWDLAGGELGLFLGHETEVTCVAIRGDAIVSGDLGGTAIVWDFQGRPRARLEGHTAEIRSVRFSNDGTRILTASRDHTARVWDARGALLATIQHDDPVWTAIYSPDGGRILTTSGELLGDRSPAARIFDLRGQLLRTVPHDDWVIGAAFAHGGRRFATTSLRSAYLWNERGERSAVLKGHTHWIATIAFSPSDARLLTASFDKTARLWDESGREHIVLAGHTLPVASACFAPDGGCMLTASFDGTVRLWSNSGSELVVLRGHAGPVNAAVFDETGNRIVSASADGTLRVWAARERDLLAVADARITREFSSAERRRYADLLESPLRDSSPSRPRPRRR